MGHRPTRRALVALLAFAHTLILHAEPPSPEPKLDLTSTIVKTLGLRAEYPVDKLGQSGCVRELTRIRGAKIASIGGQPVSMGAAASLYYWNGKLTHIPDMAQVPKSAIIRPAPDLKVQVRNVERFFSEGIQSMDPNEYRYLEQDMREVRAALEARAEQTGTAEAKELAASYQRLQQLVGKAKYDAMVSNHKAMTDPKNYEGAKDFFKTVDELRAHMPRMMELAAEAESTTATSAAAAATVSAEAEVVEAGATGALRGGAMEAEEQAVAETATRGTLGRGLVLGANVFLGLAAIVGIALHAFDTPEREAKRYAAEGAKVAAAWTKQPDANDAYVFGASVSEVCNRAVKDPKGFGQVVSEKMGAVEYWDALNRSIKLKKALDSRGNMMAAVTEYPDKHFNGEPYNMDAQSFDLRAPDPNATGEMAL